MGAVVREQPAAKIRRYMLNYLDKTTLDGHFLQDGELRLDREYQIYDKDSPTVVSVKALLNTCYLLQLMSNDSGNFLQKNLFNPLEKARKVKDLRHNINYILASCEDIRNYLGREMRD